MWKNTKIENVKVEEGGGGDKEMKMLLAVWIVALTPIPKGSKNTSVLFMQCMRTHKYYFSATSNWISI